MKNYIVRFRYLPLLLGVLLIPGGHPELNRFALAMCLGMLTCDLLFAVRRKWFGK
ncbi:MAG: hypothetical protein RIR59_1499 [Pseudomonadota bacterium]|jgi:hypothetical protein